MSVIAIHPNNNIYDSIKGSPVLICGIFALCWSKPEKNVEIAKYLGVSRSALTKPVNELIRDEWLMNAPFEKGITVNHEVVLDRLADTAAPVPETRKELLANQKLWREQVTPIYKEEKEQIKRFLDALKPIIKRNPQMTLIPLLSIIAQKIRDPILQAFVDSLFRESMIRAIKEFGLELESLSQLFRTPQFSWDFPYEKGGVFRIQFFGFPKKELQKILRSANNREFMDALVDFMRQALTDKEIQKHFFERKELVIRRKPDS